MDIKKSILSGVIFTISYIIIYLMLFYIVPEDQVYELFSNVYSEFIPETMWINIFSSLLLVGAMIVNSLLFYIFFVIRKMR